MDEKKAALKRRIAPSTALVLDLDDENGAKFSRSFRLCFDFNAAALIQEHTGQMLTNAAVWKYIDQPIFQSIMFWAAVLANHPEYAGEEGLAVLRSYMDERTADPIKEALWKAYLAYLPAKKREFMEKIKTDAEAALQEGKEPPTVPLAGTPPANPPTAISDGSSSGPSPDTT
jgi:hypothetical protein